MSPAMELRLRQNLPLHAESSSLVILKVTAENTGEDKNWISKIWL